MVTARNRVAVGIFCALGRVFMTPVDCPFHAADRVLAAMPANVRVMLMDFHAEATSDKQLMGRMLDGRVTAVLGTHTHVPTADEQILKGGTAFQCDVGMTGPHESILGRRIDRVMETTRTFRPTQFEVAAGDVRIHGTIVDADPETGRATAIRRLVVDEAQAQQLASLAAAERGEAGALESGEGEKGSGGAEPNTIAGWSPLLPLSLTPFLIFPSCGRLRLWLFCRVIFQEFHR